MKKFILKAILVFILVFALTLPAFAAGLENFKPSAVYSGQFSDVSSSAWYFENVKYAYELGLMTGSAADRFNSAGNLTLAEAVTLAARLHSIYHTGETLNIATSSVWYAPYVIYANEHSIFSQFEDYTLLATRADFAMIFASALPDPALQPINTVLSIPDVNISADYGSAVFALYRAGILTGSDDFGTFNPSSNISRVEAAAIVTRMADLALRKTADLPKRSISTYYNDLASLKVTLPAQWILKDISLAALSPVQGRTSTLSTLDPFDYYDGGYGVFLLELWNREDDSDSEHVGFMAYLEDYRGSPFKSESEYLSYFDQFNSGSFANGYTATLSSIDKMEINGRGYTRISYAVTHPDNTDIYYDDYYILPLELENVYLILNVTYWEGNTVGSADAAAAVREIVTLMR